MKTLSSEEDITISLKIPDLAEIVATEIRFQELYDCLNQYKLRKDHILISIIIPAYNEEKTIKRIIESLPYNNSIEIIVIDDKSTDNSVREVQKVNGNREIKLVRHKQNRGYGGAVITGINHAKGDVIVTMDSDGQHCPEDIIKLVKPIFKDEADCTIGSRYLGTNYYNLPIKTRLGEAIIEKLLKVFFGQKIMNNQNGFRAFNKKLKPILKKARYQGFAYATETVILTLINKKRIKECPIKVYDRKHGSSKINLANLMLDLLSCFLRYFCKITVNVFSKQKGNN